MKKLLIESLVDGCSQMHRIVEEDIGNIVDHPVSWERFRGSSVLISGAGGFLPFYCVTALLSANKRYDLGLRVIALLRNLNSVKQWPFRGRADLEIISQDVSAPLPSSIRADFIIHAASQASPRYYGSDPVGTLLPNTVGTANLLNLAVQSQAKAFLFFSSSEVYGSVPPEVEKISEDAYGYLDPLSVRSCYAESKRMGENMCVSWFHQFGVPVKIVRPFHIYGPGMRLNDGRVQADFVRNIVEGKDLIMKSDGSTRRSFCYISDATRGFLSVLLHGEDGEAFNVGSDSGEISVGELADLLVGLYPERKLKVIRATHDESSYLPSKVQRCNPSIAKISALNWAPKVPLISGFRRTVESYL